MLGQKLKNLNNCQAIKDLGGFEFASTNRRPRYLPWP